MDTTQNQDDQNQQNTAQSDDQTTVTPGGKESGSTAVSAEQDPLKEYASHKSVEVSPEVESSGVTPANPPSINQQKVNDDLSNAMPADPAHITKKDVKKAQKIEETGDIRSGTTWFAAFLEFIEKKILKKERNQKIV